MIEAVRRRRFAGIIGPQTTELVSAVDCYVGDI